MEKDPEMLKIVECPQCHRNEYYGMIHMRNGKSMCRRCIYGVWEKESGYSWEPSTHDHVFPLYEDGVDYTKCSGN
jgi:hypothetical protein